MDWINIKERKPEKDGLYWAKYCLKEDIDNPDREEQTHTFLFSEGSFSEWDRIVITHWKSIEVEMIETDRGTVFIPYMDDEAIIRAVDD